MSKVIEQYIKCDKCGKDSRDLSEFTLAKQRILLKEKGWAFKNNQLLGCRDYCPECSDKYLLTLVK